MDRKRRHIVKSSDVKPWRLTDKSTLLPSYSVLNGGTLTLLIPKLACKFSPISLRMPARQLAASAAYLNLRLDDAFAGRDPGAVQMMLMTAVAYRPAILI